MIPFLSDLVHLFYPRVCSACNTALYKHEEVICTRCLYEIPKTNFHLGKDNLVSQLFWGKFPLESAGAYYYFRKGSKVQHLLHQFKYKNSPDIGVRIGQLYGEELVASGCPLPDVIVPIPLHPKKLVIRGYNQSERFAEGLSQSLKIPVDTKNFIRNTFTETQTRKSRFDRWNNVKDIFYCVDPELFNHKHILLVDDVITTGSTIESSAQKLLSFENIELKISVASMAVASR
jgi:ComF family protein